MKPHDKAPGAGGDTGRKNGAPRASKCALCSKPVVEKYRPFCSKRCTEIDLGRWLKGQYAFPGTPGETGETTTDEH